jgi:hypothetical protein
MQGLPDVRAVDGSEAGWQDTDDGVGVLVDVDALAEDMRIGIERVAPEVFA